ncbi:MFS transporter [Nonomuraea sp. NPDC049695]|uniref:MFS transporter n=1 Tax=Nonomuraea sp. NPDC049695 TaxID=3154734 RepID=UPI003414ABAC
MAFTHADQPPFDPPAGTGPVVGRTGEDDLPKVGASYIWLLVLAVFGSYMALVTPISISLAIKVEQLAPANEEYLGYITGAGAFTALIASPLLGMLSDRTRSRFGRRRPYIVGLTVVGSLALVVMAQASSILVLGLGWMLAQLGWGGIMGLLIASQADRLPESQRGKVSGLSGVVQQLAPVSGTMMAGGLAGNHLLLFLVPGGIGVLAMVAFACFVREPDSRDLPATTTRLTVLSLVRVYLFDPRQNPDFAWNWLGRLLFMTGLTFNTTFTAFFLADRMDVSVAEVAGIIAVFGLGGIIAASAGAIGGGFLSDKLRRRRVFVLLGGAVVAVGAVVMALSSSVPVILGCSILVSFGIGIFSAVDMALALDVLPDRDAEAGRYVGIVGFSTSLAQGVAPLIAPLILAIGASGGEKNYTLLYLIAGALTLASGLVVLLRVKSVR